MNEVCGWREPHLREYDSRSPAGCGWRTLHLFAPMQHDTYGSECREHEPGTPAHFGGRCPLCDFLASLNGPPGTPDPVAKRVYSDELPWARTFGRRCRARLAPSDSTYGHFGRCELAPHSREQDHALERGLETLTWRSTDSITLTDYSPAHLARFRAEKAP